MMGSPSSSHSASQPHIEGQNPLTGQLIREATVCTGEHRPWGNYRILSDTPHYKCKQLQVLPGQRLSLQLHHHREEYWIITRGEGQLRVGDEERRVSRGETVYIPVETLHRLENTADTLLELIEVQLGDSFEESDIVRFDDDYKRC
jgi:mannose-6-phosphate isomerase-like protein (cupin superfamily)